MKRPGIVAVGLFVLFALFISGTKHVNSDPEGLPDSDSIAGIEIPEPIDILEIITEYDSLLSAGINNTNTVGAAVAIVYKNQLAYLKCFGVKKARTNDSIDENTIFRLASVSKPVSGVLAGMLAEDKLIDLNDKVKDYIPDLKLKHSNYTEELTIKNLLTHTTGLVPHAYDDLVELKMPLEKIVSRLYLANTTSSPGQMYGYQNVMFSLIDPILSEKTGKSYGDILKEKVFDPFGMTNASTGFESFKNNENKALPHSGRTTIRLNDRYYNTAPAAGVNASISDMSNFLLTILKDSTTAISENVEEMIFTPQINTVLSRGYFRQWDEVHSKSYGIGWRLIDYKNRKVAYHGGYLQGYRAEIALCKDEQAGIVYLSNSPSAVAAKSVPLFLDLLFEFKDWQKLASASNEENFSAD
jgi:beta-lactamase class C